MRKLETFTNTILPETLAKLLTVPPNVITVGPANCLFTNLADALENSKEGDTFIVFGGVHTGTFKIRDKQSFLMLGRPTLYSPNAQYLLEFVKPANYNPQTSTGTINAYFNGEIYLDFPENYLALAPTIATVPWSGNVNLHGFFINIIATVTQSATSNPNVSYSAQRTSYNYTRITQSNTRDSIGLYILTLLPYIAGNFQTKSLTKTIVNKNTASIVSNPCQTDWYLTDIANNAINGTAADGLDIDIFISAEIIIEYV